MVPLFEKKYKEKLTELFERNIISKKGLSGEPYRPSSAAAAAPYPKGRRGITEAIKYAIDR
jgi:hypothetical protein